MDNDAKEKLTELVVQSQNSLDEAENLIQVLEQSGFLGISDDKFHELNYLLARTEPELRSEIMSQFTKIINKKLLFAGFSTVEISKLENIFKEKWASLIQRGAVDFNSKELYENSLNEWEYTLSELVNEKKKQDRKQLINRLEYLQMSFVLPAAIGGALIGNEIFPAIGALIGGAVGALFSSLAKEVEND